MKSRIRSLACSLVGIALLTLAWGLLVLFALYAGASPVARTVSAQNVPPVYANPCDFRAIYLTAGSSPTFRISDTFPGGATGRTVYFANHQPGTIGVLAVISDTCYVWGGTAFSQTEPMPFQPGGTNWLWLVYPVGIEHRSETIVLTSSLYVTGSLLIPASTMSLTFTQDVTAPHDVVITVPDHGVETALPLSWSANDSLSDVDFYTVQYRLATNTSWQDILTRTKVTSVTFTALVTGVEYVFRATAYDYVGNHATSDEISTYVGPFRVYLPLVLRNFPPIPTGSIRVEGDASNAYQLLVTLNLSATVERDVVTEVRLRDEGADWADWESFTPTKSWQLSDGISGPRVVYAQFKGSAGGVSKPVSDRVYLVLNGNFEYGPDLTAWRAAEAPLPVSPVEHVVEKPDGTSPPADGNYALLLGNPAYACAPDGVPQGFAAVEQRFRLPADARRLIFHYVIWSQDASLGITYDRFEIYVDDDLAFSDGNQVNELSCTKWWRVPGPENPRGAPALSTSGWATGTIDLVPYAGKDVVVSFRNYNRIDGWYNTYTYLDAVAIEGDW